MKRIRRVAVTIGASVMLGLCGSCDREQDPAAGAAGPGATATARTTENTKATPAAGARATGGVFKENSAEPATRPATQVNR